MTLLTPKSSGLGELGDRTLRKVRRRVMPLIVLLYFVAYLDRNNVGFAKLTMSEDIGLNAAAYGLGAGIFFLGYALLEVPSNAGMYRFGARKWLARILITWGIFATAMCLVNGETTYYIVRFLLGAAEAGFFPAILFYLTLWFPAAQRVTVLGIFILAQPVSNALGAPVSGLLLQMDGVMGLQGWQWLYIIEGIPAILLGLLTPILMTDRPRDAKWLEADERNWLTATMDAELAAKSQSGKHNFLAGLKDKRTLVYSALYFGLVCGIYGLGLWMPTIVAALGKFSTAEVGFIVFIPYAVAAVFVYFWSKRADRTGKRAWHAAVSMVLAAVGTPGRRLPAAGQPCPRDDRPDGLGHGDLRGHRPVPLDALRRPDRCGRRFRTGPGELPRKPRRLHLPVRRRPPQGRHRQQPERPAVPVPLPVPHRGGHLPLRPQAPRRRRRP